MSPYPSQTNREMIVETARMLIERDGVEDLSLGKVAAELGIKAPSLYGHIKNKHALMKAVIEDSYLRLFQTYDQALAQKVQSPKDQLLNLARGQFNFAHANPNAYMLAFTAQDPDFAADPEMLLERAVAIQKIMAQISGEEDSLPALRGLLALIHGFVTLVLNGQLRRGGDLAETMDIVLLAYLKGWEKNVSPKPNK